MRIAVLMPAYEEGERLSATLAELAAAASAAAHETVVFVVDDGSRVPIALENRAGLRVVLARHPVNLGQGAAIETARRLALTRPWNTTSAAKRSSAGASDAAATTARSDVATDDASGFDVFVTMDSDGQHRAEDALALAAAIAAGADVALGDRFAGASNIPFARRVLLQLARVFERWTTGLVLADAHNGLRAFSPRAIGHMRLRQNRMAHATELTRRIGESVHSARALKLVEVPVSVRYTAETLAKGQTAGGAISILVDLFQGFLFGSEP